MNDTISDEIGAWDRSYAQGDNFVFYPHEEVVRFVSRYIRQRTGLDRFVDKRDFGHTPSGLDLGCGIGRHVRFMDDMGLDAFGVDLSSVAITEAKRLSSAEGREHLLDRFQIGSVADLPYPDHRFDFILSHGVLDSMPFDVARIAMSEAARVLRSDGLFYLDLISGDDPAHYPQFAGEEKVTAGFEQDTIQSYFNYCRIRELIDGYFDMLECTLIQHRNLLGRGWHGRYHLVLTPARRSDACVS